jgi:hypothetical protein
LVTRQTKLGLNLIHDPHPVLGWCLNLLPSTCEILDNLRGSRREAIYALFGSLEPVDGARCLSNCARRQLYQCVERGRLLRDASRDRDYQPKPLMRCRRDSNLRTIKIRCAE